MRVKKIGVLSLQGAVTEHLGHVEKCGATAVPVKVPDDLSRVEGLIIPGGESTTIGLLMGQHGLDRAVKEKYARGELALFGTCAGMVLISGEVEDGKPGQSLLALMDITVRRNAFGRQKESFEAELSFKGIENTVNGVFIRAPLITKTNSREVEVLATIEEGIIAARQGRILVTSFHPELTDDLAVHEYFIKLLTSNPPFF